MGEQPTLPGSVWRCVFSREKALFDPLEDLVARIGIELCIVDHEVAFLSFEVVAHPRESFGLPFSSIDGNDGIVRNARARRRDDRFVVGAHHAIFLREPIEKEGQAHNDQPSPENELAAKVRRVVEFFRRIRIPTVLFRIREPTLEIMGFYVFLVLEPMIVAARITHRSIEEKVNGVPQADDRRDEPLRFPKRDDVGFDGHLR